jgi:hypothetical protein
MQALASRQPHEISLLRQSLGRLAAGRHVCVHCHRTPLVGERVYVYAGTDGDAMVCELCRPLRREAPERSELMHSPEHDRAVRRRRAA